MRTTANVICIVAAAGLSVCLTVEHRASLELERENNGLRQRLDQTKELATENQRLSNLVAEANGLPARKSRTTDSAPKTEDPVEELVRLRGEVTALRLQSKEIETLRANTREVRIATETAQKTKSANRAANNHNTTAANGTQFELLRADYGTDKTNLDVAAELGEKIRGDSLKAIASNNLNGDPDFGQVKHLTVVYRFGGVTMTNQFREGDFVVLPKAQEQ